MQQGSMNEKYRGFSHAVRCIVHEEGIKGLYRGWAPEVALWTVYGSLYLVLFREVKHQARRITGQDQLFVSQIAVSAGIASGITAFFTSPLDVFKLHFQTKPTVTAKELITGISQVGMPIWMRGSGARVLSVAPRTTVCFTMFEYLRSIQIT
eukprot:TRINITY_DN14282_c0_g1_i4.p1 TRINITY_DN14282_c0_g1~~TRINITY_DN14282_c0_g1_i4.p1  ORF type:complete len:152 (-),score=5.11 TRINITY_DN14282_c0_g1_i4:143-598(-)